MIRAMLFAIGLAFVLAAGPAARAQSSQFKGWIAVTRELSTRLAENGQALDLDQFVPADDLTDLLGTWFIEEGERRFLNGAPNSVNMVVWRVVLSGFAKSVGESCRAPQLAFNRQFLATLRELCAWPAPAAQAEPAMLAFWLSVMGYDAPETEYVAWRDFFRRAYATRPAPETIEAMTFAITMNPFFLLNK